MENSSGKSALGLDGNITALIGYLIGIIALILVFIEKDNKFVRFHAWQSLLLNLGVGVLFAVLGIVGAILGIVAAAASPDLALVVGGLLSLVFGVLCLAVFIAVIFAAYKGFQGQFFKLPIIGNFAEKMANK